MLKENDKAKTLIEEGEKNCAAARVALADTMRRMAQLELETAINMRRADFIKSSLAICEDLVFHAIRNNQQGNTKRTIEALAFICFHSFSKETLEKGEYFKKFLDLTCDIAVLAFYDEMLAIADPNHNVEVDDLMSPSITANETLTIHEVTMKLESFFVAVTQDLKNALDLERKTKEDNARVIARRKAKDIAAATAATAESLEKEPIMDHKTMLALIQEESDKAAKKNCKSYLQSALRKKSSGSRRPTTATTEPTTKRGKKQKAELGNMKHDKKRVRFNNETETTNAASKPQTTRDKPNPNKKAKNKKNEMKDAVVSNNKKAKSEKQRSTAKASRGSNKKQNGRGGKRKGETDVNTKRKKARQHS